MSYSDHKSDEYHSPLYHEDGFSDKVGYFKVAHVKINSNELFWDFLEAYKHAIPSRVRVKRVKDDSGHEPCSKGATTRKRAIKFHVYYFMLGFTFLMLRLFLEVICSMKYMPAQCSPNAVRVMVGFSNLSRFFDLDLTINKFWYFFKIDHKESVGQLRSRHKLLDASCKSDQRETPWRLVESGSLTPFLSYMFRLPLSVISEPLHS
ncbi:hypothetical protein COP1_024923 [Malus domestica]